MNDTLDQMDLTDIFRTFHPKTMEYYSAIRKDDYPTFALTWMGLEEITLIEIS